MPELSPSEARRQADILWPIRMQHHSELGRSGAAWRIITMAPQMNLGKYTSEPLTEGSLLVPTQIPITDRLRNHLRLMEEADPALALIAWDLIEINGHQGHLLTMRRYESSEPSQWSTESYYAGLQAEDPSTERPLGRIFGMEAIPGADAELVARLLGELALAKAEYNLTCLNDSLINDQIDDERLYPLP